MILLKRNVSEDGDRLERDYMRNHFDFCLANKQELAKQIYNAKHDKGASANGGGCSGISKPTERDAMYNLKAIKEVKLFDFYVVRWPQRMMNVIEYTRLYFNDKPDGVIYKARYIDKEDWNKTCDRLNISKTNYYRRVCKILTVARNRWGELKK